MKYRVKLARPVIQTVWIEVNARSETAAVERAAARASRLPAASWKGGFDKKNYSYDVQHVWSQDDLAEAEADPEDLDTDQHRYALLRADTEAGQGVFIPQPWMAEESHLLIADVSGDWLEQVQEVHEDGVAGFVDSLAASPAEKDEPRSAKVISILPYLMGRLLPSPTEGDKF